MLIGTTVYITVNRQNLIKRGPLLSNNFATSLRLLHQGLFASWGALIRHQLSLNT